MQIKSSVETTITTKPGKRFRKGKKVWKEGVEKVLIKQGTHTYPRLDTKNPMVISQLLALKECGMIEFEVDLTAQPEKKEPKKEKKSKRVKVVDVRTDDKKSETT